MFQDDKFHIVPSVRSIKNLDQALKGREEWILLSGIHIGNLRECTAQCHRAGKKVIVNHEIVGGLGLDKTAFQMLKRMFQVDAVMGSGAAKLNMIYKEDLRAIWRVPLIDSLAVDQVFKGMKEVRCDMIELRPAYYALKYLEQFQKLYPCEYVAGGFVDSVDMLEAVCQAGFSGVMTSCIELWNYELQTFSVSKK